MGEEEIIKVITYKLNMKNADVYAPILYEEIQNLLDLYNKEKEKTTKQEKMIQKICENFCKFDWKNSNGEQVHNQLKELYESIFKTEEE